MKLLSDMNIDDIKVGLKVISNVTNNTGEVSRVWYNELYDMDDIEKNPCAKIHWINGNISNQPLIFLDKIQVVE